MSVEQEEIVATEPAYRLYASPLYGYRNPDSPWQSDAGTVMVLSSKNPVSVGISPTQLRIRAAAAIDSLQLWVVPTDSDQDPTALTQFGKGGGTSHTLEQKQIELIDRIWFWGTNKYNTPRLGQIHITFKNNYYQPQTFGSGRDVALGSFQVPDGLVLVGFTGDSGTMVDGISLLLAEPGR